jgi:hypothetical protein
MEMASPCFSLVSRDGDGDKFGVLPRRVAPWLHFAAERVAGKFTLFMPSRRPRTMPPHDPELLDGEVEAALALFLEESCSRLWLRVPLDGRGAAALLAAGGAAGVGEGLDGDRLAREENPRHEVHLGGGAVAEEAAELIQRRPVCKDSRFEGKEKMTWYGGTHDLGRRIGKLLEETVF